ANAMKACCGKRCRREVGHDEVRLPFLPERSPCAEECGELSRVRIAAAEKDFRIAVGPRAQHAFGCRSRSLEDIEVACLGKECQRVQLAEAEGDVMSALRQRVCEGCACERMSIGAAELPRESDAGHLRRALSRCAARCVAPPRRNDSR